MEGFVYKSFNLNLSLMRILGFYPPENCKLIYKVYAYCVYCFFTISIPVLAALNLLLDESVDITQISDNAFLVCESGCFIIKFLPFVKNPDLIKSSVFLVEQQLFSVYSKRQEVYVNECIYVCKRNCLLFLSFCLITLINWAVVPFFVPGNNLPVEIWLPFDYKKSLRLYISSFVFVVVGVGNGALSSGVVDPLLAGLISHARCQLKILKNNLQFLGEDIEMESLRCENVKRDLLKSELVYNKIRKCIEHHNAIINFVKVYEKTYSSSVFVQFAASVVVICISCLRLSMVKPFTFTFFAMVLFLCTMLSEIFLYCYYGTILFEENNRLTEAIYTGQWYNYDIRTKKALITIMERSKRPMTITAGRILDLSLETFTTILRRAYSLLALLKNYHNE